MIRKYFAIKYVGILKRSKILNINALKIQCVYKMRRAINQLKQLRLLKACVFIQSFWRGIFFSY